MTAVNDNDTDFDPDLDAGNVYLIACYEPLSIKIGFTSKDPRARLRQLQTANPSELELLGWFPGDLTSERRLHQRLARWRMAGEWFRVEDGEEWSRAFEGLIHIMRINNHLTGFRKEFDCE